MALTFEEFKELKDKGLSPQQIADFEDGVIPKDTKKGFFDMSGLEKYTPEGAKKASGNNNIFKRIKKVALDTVDNYKGIAQTYDEDRMSDDKTIRNMAIPKMLLSSTAMPARAGGELVGETVKEVIGTAAPVVKDRMKSWLESIVSSPAIKDNIIEPYTEWSEENPRKSRAVKDVVDIGTAALFAKGAKPSVNALKSGTDSLVATGEKTWAEVVKTGEKITADIMKPAEQVAQVLATSPTKVIANRAANVVKVNDLVNVITRGKPGALAATKNTIFSMDTTGLKTFEQLATKAGEMEGVLRNSVDDVLSQNPTLYKLPELNIVKGYNYTEKALNVLEDLYIETINPDLLELVKELSVKAKTEGLTSKEINDLAREFGTEVASKGYNAKTGEPLKGINAQMEQNIRTGMKDTVRALNGNNLDLLTNLDGTLSEFISTKDLFVKLAQETTTKGARLFPENQLLQVGAQVGATAATAANLATGGGLMGLINKIIPANKLFNKNMSVLDLQKILEKTLTNVKKIDADGGGNVFNKLIDAFPKVESSIADKIAFRKLTDFTKPGSFNKFRSPDANFMIASAENPMGVLATKSQNSTMTTAFRDFMKKNGINFKHQTGKYGNPEISNLIEITSPEQRKLIDMWLEANAPQAENILVKGGNVIRYDPRIGEAYGVDLSKWSGNLKVGDDATDLFSKIDGRKYKFPLYEAGTELPIDKQTFIEYYNSN